VQIGQTTARIGIQTDAALVDGGATTNVMGVRSYVSVVSVVKAVARGTAVGEVKLAS
jgi:hypothetical protein